MTRVLLVVSGSSTWTLKDGTKHPTGFWASEFIHPHQVFTKAGYDVVYVSSGHGPMEDLADNPVIGEIYAAVYPKQDKVAAAVCHGVGALLPARSADGSWLFAGKQLTGFTGEEETAFGFGDKAPRLLETRLRENGAAFAGGPAFGAHVVTDGNLITGQNPASAGPSAEAVVNYLTAQATTPATA